ncbi:hypothetical protein [Streptomyces sp. NPDC001500]
MNAGLAAVLGAVVGALGTALAAWITGMWGSKNTQQQLDAQRGQAELQHRRDHQRERSVPRKQAYADLITKTMQYVDRVVVREPTSYEQSQDLMRAATMVELEGPDSLMTEARALKAAIHDCQSAGDRMVRLNTPDPDAAAREADRRQLMLLRDINEALKAFTDAARDILDGPERAANAPGRQR